MLYYDNQNKKSCKHNSLVISYGITHNNDLLELGPAVADVYKLCQFWQNFLKEFILFICGLI
jgi:hypothetical protein